jgi:hypothetical protein
MRFGAGEISSYFPFGWRERETRLAGIPAD